MFTEVKQTSKPLPQLVSEEIEKLIVLGEFKPGDRLPSEYELAQRLGVGRSTVREATKALVSRNILEVHRGNGTFVCEQTGLVQDPLGLRFQPDKKRLGLDHRVIIHGILHLCGINDKGPGEREIMEAAENKALAMRQV